ncbi:putative E3 SUMO-protein ligase NSE2-like [Apostichopus japonicus]|uniref:E3 SUMO-protein ligase NSE2 n=1 Tax=Stichopus japonicus TaxID=307972 RepID=A0A2G8LLY1_STIJA|nr:putative E3 SUMO-protein ligase NSE2-like [Apostichopus japonicus]
MQKDKDKKRMANSGRAHFEVVNSAVRGLAKVQTYIEQGMSDVIEVSLDLAENGGENEGSLHNLEEMMKEYIALDADLQKFNEAVSVVTQQCLIFLNPKFYRVNRKMRQIDPKAEFNVQSKLRHQLEETDEPLQDPENHDKMIELKEKLWQLQHPGEGMPTQETVAGSQSSQDEDEPTMTQVEVCTKCPISQGEMVDPVKNKTCGHSYERKAVAELMKQRRGMRCPVTGCHNKNPLLQRDLVDNKELKMLIERRNRQTGKRGN